MSYLRCTVFPALKACYGYRLIIFVCLVLAGCPLMAKGNWQLVEPSMRLSTIGTAVGYSRANGKALYACQANLWGSRQVGVTWPGQKKCILPYAGKAYSVDKFFIFSHQAPLQWQPYYGFFPDHAKVIGTGVKKVPLVLCRGYYHRSLLVGKTWHGHKTCDVIDSARRVHPLKRYSVLVQAKKLNTKNK